MANNSILKKLKPISIGSAMADMALLLLIFFMATTSTEPPKGVDVELPKAKSKAAEQDSHYITIGKNKALYVNGTQIAIQDLGDWLDMRANEKNNVVAITADKGLQYKEVGAVLTILQQKDFLNIVFMSESREKAKQ